ncbi:MAG: hypothetical protein EBT21_06770 [Actinobacteria bacterium]|nr:hypothetical protein [Actinomycetota bacterium]
MYAFILGLLISCVHVDVVKEGNDQPQTGDTGSNDTSGIPTGVDDDGDGFLASQDCDDADPATFPGAAEVCNGVDDDCDGSVDDGASDAPLWFLDGDGDGYGDPNGFLSSCAQPYRYVSNQEDCDDTDAAVRPDTVETCNGVDDDCDGSVDENPTVAGGGITVYIDRDHDHHGGAQGYDEQIVVCEAEEGWALENDDCDDANAATHPGAVEICNAVDDDCDGSADDHTVDGNVYFFDGDGDGFGDNLNTARCNAPPGYIAFGTDCDDTLYNVYPGAPELCDLLDNNCNGTPDEGAALNTWYFDNDHDGAGAPGAQVQMSCVSTGNYTGLTEDDCDDVDASVYVGAPELLDRKDNDCDGIVD